MIKKKKRNSGGNRRLCPRISRPSPARPAVIAGYGATAEQRWSALNFVPRPERPLPPSVPFRPKTPGVSGNRERFRCGLASLPVNLCFFICIFDDVHRTNAIQSVIIIVRPSVPIRIFRRSRNYNFSDGLFV